MGFETAGNVLVYDEDWGKAIGEFWVGDNRYDVVASRNDSFSDDIRIEIEDFSGYNPQKIEKHHRINSTGSRSYAGTESRAQLPTTSEHLEAYVLKALSKDDVSLIELAYL